MNKEWGWVWPLPGNVSWDLRENRNIWNVGQYDGDRDAHNPNMRFFVGADQPVHTVEAGTVIQNGSMKVAYSLRERT